MHGSPELLEFYLVEATEYLDTLDQLIGNAGVAPDGNAFIATARALRGTSNMAKADVITEISVVLEQVAHGVRDGELRWTMDLYRSLRDTVDDMRLLVRAVRTWGERERARAEARLADLRRFLPGEPARVATPAAAATTPVFVALQASAIAAELDAFVSNPAHRRALADALTRVRTLRGIAGLADYAPLADVADAVDRAGRRLVPDAPPSAREAELFRAAAAVLRKTSERLRTGTARPGGDMDDAHARFAHAVDALESAAPVAEPERIVPIEELFYADGGPGIVQRASEPPMDPEQRFREDVAMRAEHVQRLIGDARGTGEVSARERVARELRSVLLEIERVSASFGAHQVGSFFGEAAREVHLLDDMLLDALDAGSSLLLDPTASARGGSSSSAEGALHDIEHRLAVLERARRHTPTMTPPVAPPPVEARSAPPDVPATPMATTPLSATPVRSSTPPASSAQSTPAAVAPVPDMPGTRPPDAVPARHSPVAGVPAVAERARAHGLPRRAAATPSGRELQALLQEGIASFQTLEDAPLSEPTPMDGDDIVPIEALLFRGQSALRRAVQVRDDMRARGITDDVVLQEIYDLLDLASTE